MQKTAKQTNNIIKTSSSKKVTWKQIGLLLLIGLGIAILLAVGWLIGGNDMLVPNSLAGLPLSRLVTGQTALTEIEQLHGKDFVIIDGAVANYGEGMATLWISSTWLPSVATQQVVVMTERIAEGRSPFSPIGNLEIEGITVYVLTGMGQVHYYFQINRQVVWLAVPPQISQQSLEELIHSLQ